MLTSKRILYPTGRSAIWTMFETSSVEERKNSDGAQADCARGNDWYALYTSPRHEKRVAEQIQQRRISCFLPLYRSIRRWKDRRKELELALFPGYVFVQLELRDRLKVLQLPGVVRFVSFNGHPAALPQAEIESLRKGLNGCVRMSPHPYLRDGRRVRMSSGPLAGLEGILHRRRNRDKEKLRLVVSIEMLMRAVAVEVDEADIEPC